MLQVPEAFCIHQLFPTSSSHSLPCSLLGLSPNSSASHMDGGFLWVTHILLLTSSQCPCPSTHSPSTQQHLSFKKHIPRVYPPGTCWNSPAHPQLSWSVEFMTRLRVPKSGPGQQGKQHPCPYKHLRQLAFPSQMGMGQHNTSTGAFSPGLMGHRATVHLPSLCQSNATINVLLWTTSNSLLQIKALGKARTR